MHEHISPLLGEHPRIVNILFGSCDCSLYRGFTVHGLQLNKLHHFKQIWHTSRVSYYEHISGYWAISNSASDGWGSHFSKWPTSDTVMMHICLTGEECRLTVKDY